MVQFPKWVWGASVIASVVAAVASHVRDLPHTVAFVAEQLVLYTLYYAEIWLGLGLLLWGAWRLFLGKSWRGYLLCKACTEGQMDEVERLLRAGVEPDNYTDYVYGGTALHYSCAKGHASVVRLLIKKEGEEMLMRRMKNGFTCLHLAAESGHAQVAKDIIAAVTPARRRELLLHRAENGMSCLHLAVIRAHLDVVKLLVQTSGQLLVSMLTKEGDTCLHFAARNGRVDILQLLLDAGAQKNLENDNGRTGLPFFEKGAPLARLSDSFPDDIFFFVAIVDL